MNVKNNQAVVSRAEWKLYDAVRSFRFDFRGKTVLDIGSSTGGFTELALRLGAEKVIAVEKGTNQMKRPLRDDPRIELHEKTDIFLVNNVISSPRSSRPSSRGSAANASRVPRGERQQPPRCAEITLSTNIDVILADVSFVSLTKVLAHARDYLSDKKTDFLVMLKPQFEAKPEQLVKGIVKNEKMRREIIKNFEIWLKNNGFVIVKKRDNELSGRNGNIERFYWLKKT